MLYKLGGDHIGLTLSKKKAFSNTSQHNQNIYIYIYICELDY